MGMGPQTCHPSIWEVETGELRTSLSYIQSQDQKSKPKILKQSLKLILTNNCDAICHYLILFLLYIMGVVTCSYMFMCHLPGDYVGLKRASDHPGDRVINGYEWHMGAGSI